MRINQLYTETVLHFHRTIILADKFISQGINKTYWEQQKQNAISVINAMQFALIAEAVRACVELMKPIPKYNTVTNHPGGLAIVGEKSCVELAELYYNGRHKKK